MTKKLSIAILILISVLVLIFGAAIFYASKILTSEKMNFYAKQAVSKAMPSAEVDIGKIDLSFGFSVTAEISELNLKLNSKYQQRPLLKVQDASLKIPLWAILTGGGTVQLNLQSPAIYYTQLGAKDNWQYALEGKKQNATAPSVPASKGKSAPTKEANEAKSMELPAIVAAVRLNIQVADLHLNYALNDKSQGDIVIDRLLVKQLGLATTTAFEMRSNFSYQMANKEEYKLSPMLIGEFNLTDFLTHGIINNKMQLALQNIVLGNSGLLVPNIKTNLDLSVEKSGNVKGSLDTSFASSRLATNLALSSNGNIILDKIDANLLISDLLGVVKNTPMPVDLKAGASALTVKGQVAIAGGKINPNIQIALSQGLSVSTSGISAGIVANGSYDGKKIKLHSAVEMLKGIISNDFIMPIDLNQKAFVLDKLSPFQLSTKISNIELADSFIRSKIYSKSETAAPVESVPPANESNGKNAKAKAPPMNLPLLPPGVIDLEMVNLKVGSNALNGKGKVRIENRAVTTDFFNLTYGGGTLGLTHKSTLASHSLSNQFTADLRSFNLLAIRPFLPQFIDAVTGIFSGKVRGKVDLSATELKYLVDANVEARSGAIQGLKIGQFIEGFAEKLPMLKGKSFDIDSEKLANYELFTFRGQLTDKIYKVSQVEFVAINKLVELKGKGDIYPPPTKGKSALYLTYSDTKYLSRLLNEATKSGTLPVFLTGIEFDLMPDYMYSTQAIMKGAGKKAAAKAVNKATEALKQNGKKEVKKLLKSFGF